MISSILDSKRLNEDIRRENRAIRLKRYVMALLGCIALSGLGVVAYYTYRALSR